MMRHVFISLRHRLKFHWAGIAVAIAVGLLIALPPVVWHFSPGYQGVDMLKTNTEPHYVTQVREVFDGHPSLGNPFFADGKSDPYLFPPLSPNLIALFGKILFLSPILTVMVTRFLCTAALAFLVYLFGYYVSGRRLVGLVAAPAVMIGYNLVDPSALVALFRGQASGELTFIDYGRPINPQVSSLFFFGYLVSLWKFLESEQRRPWLGVVAGLLLGLSFYVYLFTWTFIFSLNGFLVIVYAAHKDWEKVKRVVAVSVGAGFLGIPYAIHTHLVSLHPAYAESAPRFGFVHTREPNVSRLVIGVFILFALLARLISQSSRRFFWAFFITALFVVNEQVITGLFVFNHHYHWYYNTPLTIVVIVLLLFAALNRWAASRPYQRSVAMVLLCVLFANGINIQTHSYTYVAPQTADEQRYAPLFRWLDSSTPTDSTVFASLQLAALIPALTHSNVYYNGTSIYTLVPNERLFHAYLIYTYVKGIPAGDARAYFESHRDEISGFVYGYTYYFQKGVCTSCFPDSVVDHLVAEYGRLNDANIIAFIKQYPIDYLVWDTKNDPDWIVGRLHLREVARFGSLIVYDLR